MSDPIVAKVRAKQYIKDEVRAEKEKKEKESGNKNQHVSAKEASRNLDPRMFETVPVSSNFQEKFALPSPIDMGMTELYQEPPPKNKSNYQPKKTIREYMEEFRKEEPESINEQEFNAIYKPGMIPLFMDDLVVLLTGKHLNMPLMADRMISTVPLARIGMKPTIPGHHTNDFMQNMYNRLLSTDKKPVKTSYKDREEAPRGVIFKAIIKSFMTLWGIDSPHELPDSE
jgi:hypothetical protein